jgi:hypothetical protein
LRRICCLLVCLLTSTSCRIEQTPDHFIDNQLTAAEELTAAEDEIRRRLLAVGPAVQRGNVTALASALAPHTDVSIIGPEDGEVLATSTELLTSLTKLAGGEPLMARTMAVTVSPRMDVAWFQSELASAVEAADDTEIRFSGVFIREEGEWRLVQGHLSQSIKVTPIQ